MGIEARSLRQKAAIINLNPSATANELADADLADAKAEEIKGMLETHLGLDSTTHSSDKLTKDNEYEALVPGFYR